MGFFNSLTLDLKLLLVGIAGCALLALFSGNHKSEKRYVLVLALLAIGGVYRFNHIAREEPGATSVATNAAPPAVAAGVKHKPLVSTSAR